MSAEKIVGKLLENDERLDPKDYIAAMGAVELSGITPEQMAVFKRQVIGYIDWINGVSDPAVAQAVADAPTFDAVTAILASYEDPQAPFMDMIVQGYF